MGCSAPRGRRDTGQGDVEGVGLELGLRCGTGNALAGFFNYCFNFSFELINAAADFALLRAGRGLQPEVVDLGQDAVLARHPAIAEFFPRGFVGDGAGFHLERGGQFRDGLVERRGRVAVEFWNAVHRPVPSLRDSDSNWPPTRHLRAGLGSAAPAGLAFVRRSERGYTLEMNHSPVRPVGRGFTGMTSLATDLHR